LREEVSGKRIYVDWAMNTYPSAEAFFKEFYIHPYCPMQFMATTGTNLTPDELHKSDRVELYDVCDRYLREAIQLLRPKRVIGIGNFADERIRDTLKRWRQEEGEEEGTDRDQELLEQLVVGKIPHPRYGHSGVCTS
jgi:single-strand selective monofunctional uracil DNA glycosylase